MAKNLVRSELEQLLDRCLPRLRRVMEGNAEAHGHMAFLKEPAAYHSLKSARHSVLCVDCLHHDSSDEDHGACAAVRALMALACSEMAHGGTRLPKKASASVSLDAAFAWFELTSAIRKVDVASKGAYTKDGKAKRRGGK